MSKTGKGKMNISELRPRQGSVNIEAVVKSIEEPRSFNKFGRDLRVTNAVIEDETGSIKLTLWNNDIDTIRAGDTVRITNGFINEFKGENQLTTGKFGKLEVIKHGEESKESAKIKKQDGDSEFDSEEEQEVEEETKGTEGNVEMEGKSSESSDEEPTETADEDYNADY